MDNTGNVIKEEKTNVNVNQIKKALEKMQGVYEQEVPIYSAVKINGKKLYEYAREGINVDLPKRMVNIKSLELINNIKYENNKTTFQIRCHVSKGTYIRSLVNDIAHELGTVGTMTSLNRVKQGIFNISDAYTLEDIENDNYKLLSIKEALSNVKQVIVSGEVLFKIKNGTRLENIYHSDKVLFLDEFDNEIALYKTLDNDDKILKVYKMF